MMDNLPMQLDIYSKLVFVYSYSQRVVPGCNILLLVLVATIRMNTIFICLLVKGVVLVGPSAKIEGFWGDVIFICAMTVQ